MATERLIFDDKREGYLKIHNQIFLVEVLGGIRSDNLDSLPCILKISKRKTSLAPIRISIDLYRIDSTDHLITTLCKRFEVSFLETQNFIYKAIDILETYRLKKWERERIINTAKRVNKTDKKYVDEVLQKEDLLGFIKENLIRAGVCANLNEALLVYISSCTSKTEQPLSLAFIDDTNISDKLFSIVQHCIPSSEHIYPSLISPQALFYFQNDELKNKTLLLKYHGVQGELLFQLKEILSRGKLQKLVSLKNQRTGLPHVMNPQFTGPLSLCISIPQSLKKKLESFPILNYHIEKSRGSEMKWLEAEKMMFAGYVNESKQPQAQNMLKNLHLCLEPINVINPFALDIFLPKHLEHDIKLLSSVLKLTSAISFIYQKKRRRQGDSIIAEVEDVEYAVDILKTQLQRKQGLIKSSSLYNFYLWLREYTLKENRGTIKACELRLANSKLSRRNLSRYLKDLLELELIKIVSGKRQTGYIYRLSEITEEEICYEDFEFYKQRLIQKITGGTSVGQEKNCPTKP